MIIRDCKRFDVVEVDGPHGTCRGPFIVMNMQLLPIPMCHLIHKDELWADTVSLNRSCEKIGEMVFQKERNYA